jgi:hypothetical protein
MDGLNIIILVLFVALGIAVAYILGEIRGMRSRINEMTDGYVTDLEEEVEKLRARE